MPRRGVFSATWHVPMVRAIVATCCIQVALFPPPCSPPYTSSSPPFRPFLLLPGPPPSLPLSVPPPGDCSWSVGAHEMPYPNSLLKYKLFAMFLLQGKVRAVLSSTPSRGVNANQILCSLPACFSCHIGDSRFWQVFSLPACCTNFPPQEVV